MNDVADAEGNRMTDHPFYQYLLKRSITPEDDTTAKANKIVEIILRSGHNYRSVTVHGFLSDEPGVVVLRETGQEHRTCLVLLAEIAAVNEAPRPSRPPTGLS